MPHGKGTYGSKVGRPRKKSGLLQDDREHYAIGGLSSKVVSAILKNTEAFAGTKGKITIKDAKKELKLAKEQIREIKQDTDMRRMDEEEFLEVLVDELEVKIRMIEEDIASEYVARDMVAEGGSIDGREQYVVGGVAKLLSKVTQKGVKDYGDVKSKIKNNPKPKKRDYDPGYYYTTSEKKEMMVDMLVEKGYSPKEIQVLLDDVYKKGNSNKMIKALDLENVNEDAYVQSTGFHPYYEAMEVKNRKKKNQGGPMSMDDQMEMAMNIEETHTMPDGTVMPGATHEEYMKEQQLPDEQMEDNYLDFIVDEALS